MINTPPGKPTITRDGDCIVVHIPMTFKRRGGRKEIIVPHGPEEKTPKAPPQSPLVMAIVRGHIWRGLLESGKVRSIAEIARANKVDGSYVSRMLDLTLLAPDILEAILDGKEPSGLSLTGLIRRQLPVLWEEQRKSFRFQNFVLKR